MHVLATLQRRGAETFAADLMRPLWDLGVDQNVVVLRPGAAGIDVGRTPVVRLDPGGRRIPGLNADGSIVTRFARAIDALSPDVIQAHGGESLKYSVLAANWRVRHRIDTPIVYRRIGTSPSWLHRGPRRVAYATLMRRASRVVTVADAVRSEVILRFGLPAARVVTISNAVDPRRLHPCVERSVMREGLGLPASSPIMLSLGALTWEKDPLMHLDVSRRVFAAVPEAIHVFLGDGPERASIERRVKELGLGERVRVLGNRPDVGDVLAAIDVVVFASRADGMEGMPATLIEAGMAGVPVAAFSVAGVSEVVADRETGFLTPPGDVDGLARRIVDLMRDRSLRSRLGAAAASRCNERFSIETVAAAYHELYEEVADLVRGST
jgi:glycosyltransferase involved in cell wall biosynthesis